MRLIERMFLPLLPLPAFQERWHSLERGRWGERAVARLLWREGFRLCAWDWKGANDSDIDLIAAGDRLLLFCEVKLRGASDADPWAEVFHPERQRRMAEAAGEYLRQTAQIHVRVRFDAFLVTPSGERPRRPDIARKVDYLSPADVPGWRGPQGEPSA